MLINLTEEQNTILEAKIETFKGTVDVLESAIGALVVGQKYGWRVAKMVHSPATIKKYEKLLGLKFEDVCPERTKLSKRNVGLRIADKLKSFWAVALGKTAVPNKAHLDSKTNETLV